MKRTFALCLIFILLLAFLGCGGSGGSVSKETASENITISPASISSTLSSGAQSVKVTMACTSDDVFRDTCKLTKAVIGLNGNAYDVPANITMKPGEKQTFSLPVLTAADLLTAPFSYLSDSNPSTSTMSYTRYSELIGNIATKVVAYGGQTCIDSLSVTPPSYSLTTYAGGKVTFTVAGGVPPYGITSSSGTIVPSVTSLPMSGSAFDVNVPKNTPPQTVNIAVKDTGTYFATVQVTITATNLSVTPATQTVKSTIGGSAIFLVNGGTPPYSIYSSDQNFQALPATIPNTGGTFTVAIPQNTLPESIYYTVTDQAHNSTSVNLVINADALTVLPSDQFINASTGGTASFSLYGGTPPYTIFTDFPSFPPVPDTVGAQGESFKITIPAGTPDQTTVHCTIKDATQAVVTSTVTASANAPAQTTMLRKIATQSQTCTGIKNFVVTLPNYTPGTLNITDGTQILNESSFGVLNGAGYGTVTQIQGGYQASFSFNSVPQSGVPITASYLLPLSPLSHAPSGNDLRIVYGSNTYTYKDGLLMDQNGQACASVTGSTINPLIPMGYSPSPMVATYSGDPFNAMGGDTLGYADGINTTYTLTTKYAPISKSTLLAFTDAQPGTVTSVNETTGVFVVTFRTPPKVNEAIKASYVVTKVDLPITIDFYTNPGGEMTFTVPLSVTK